MRQRELNSFGPIAQAPRRLDGAVHGRGVGRRPRGNQPGVTSQCVRVVGRQLQGLVEVIQRRRAVALHFHEFAEANVALNKTRATANRLLQLLRRLAGSACVHQRDRQLAPCDAELRFGPHGFAIRLDGAGDAFHSLQAVAPQHVEVEGPRTGLFENLIHQLQRFREPAGSHQRVSEVVFGRGEVGLGFDGQTVLGDGILKSTILLEPHR